MAATVSVIRPTREERASSRGSPSQHDRRPVIGLAGFDETPASQFEYREEVCDEFDRSLQVGRDAIEIGLDLGVETSAQLCDRVRDRRQLHIEVVEIRPPPPW